MRVHIADHPLIAHKLTALRDKDTDTPTFRRLVDELVTLLAYEATRDVRVEPVNIETPVAPSRGIKLASPKPLVVINRARDASSANSARPDVRRHRHRRTAGRRARRPATLWRSRDRRRGMPGQRLPSAGPWDRAS